MAKDSHLDKDREALARPTRKVQKKSYSEKLKDPRWQKRRLQILERAGFKCEMCEAADKTLHIHHKFYERGKDPWDYVDGALICVCDECHDTVASVERRFLSSGKSEIYNIMVILTIILEKIEEKDRNMSDLRDMLSKLNRLI